MHQGKISTSKKNETKYIDSVNTGYKTTIEDYKKNVWGWTTWIHSCPSSDILNYELTAKC